MLKVRFDELSDQLELTTAHNEELTLRLKGLESTVLAFNKDKENTHSRLVELTELLHARSMDAETEKNLLRKQIDKISYDIQLTKELSQPWNVGTHVAKLPIKGVIGDKDYSSLQAV